MNKENLPHIIISTVEFKKNTGKYVALIKSGTSIYLKFRGDVFAIVKKSSTKKI